MRQTVLGAGPLGTALTEVLTAAGEEAALFSIMGNPVYDMPGTTPAPVDGTNPDQVTDACEGSQVIYLCMNAHYVDWYHLLRPRLEAAITAASAVGAKLVYHDTAYVYGPMAGPATEDLPYTASTRKGALRAELATTFLDAVHSERIEGAIGRTADLYGPGALNSSHNSTLGQRHFYPLLAGKAVSIVGNIDVPHTYAFVDDVARGLMTLGRHDEALGQAWHLPAAPTLTHRDLMAIAFDVAGLRPRIRGSRISGFFVRAIGRFQRDVGEVAEMLYLFERPFVVSHAKFEAAFGADPTPHELALGKTLDWFRDNPLT